MEAIHEGFSTGVLHGGSPRPFPRGFLEGVPTGFFTEGSSRRVRRVRHEGFGGFFTEVRHDVASRD
jgi:hypothetical protein